MPFSSRVLAAFVFSVSLVHAQSPVDKLLSAKDVTARTVQSFTAAVTIEVTDLASHSTTTHARGTAAAKRTSGKISGRLDLISGTDKSSIVLKNAAYYDSDRPQQAEPIPDIPYRLYQAFAPWASSSELRSWFFIPDRLSAAKIASAKSACMNLMPRTIAARDELQSAMLCLDQNTGLPAAFSFVTKDDEVVIHFSRLQVNIPIPEKKLELPPK